MIFIKQNSTEVNSYCEYWLHVASFLCIQKYIKKLYLCIVIYLSICYDINKKIVITEGWMTDEAGDQCILCKKDR